MTYLIEQHSNGGRSEKDTLRSVKETPQVPHNHNVWIWNNTVPESVEACVHSLIKRVVCERPLAPAICAWDGDLTYQQLDQLSSRLAHQLVDLGVGPGSMIPLCFEKSLCMPLAVLGVMKAGGTSIPLDITQPAEMLRFISVQVSVPVVLSSVTNCLMAQQLSIAKVVIVDLEQLLVLVTSGLQRELPVVTPSDILCVLLDSDSPGTSKGAMMTHRNLSSAITYQQKALGFTSGCRVFDPSSYTHYMAWYNMLQTLTCGACLCIPSQADEQQNIEESMKFLRANFACLTPATSLTMQRYEIFRSVQLDHIGESGEPLRVNEEKKSILRDTDETSEALMLAATQTVSEPATPKTSARCGFGACARVADIDDPETLASAGAVGELWLEGPLIGLGYLNDAVETAAAVIRDPPWLLRVAPGGIGRHGRVQRTGDLVRYKKDGEIVFTGHKGDRETPCSARLFLNEGKNAELSQSNDDRSPQSDMERRMRALWAGVLHINQDDICIDGSFFSIGGDAVAAMRLSRKARDQGLNFTVRDVFQNPQLRGLSAIARSPNSMNYPDIPPFSLFKYAIEKEELKASAARSCRVQESDVVDVFPCTPLQEGLLALTAKRTRDYVATHIFELLETVDIERLRGAWAQVAAMNPILRSRIVSLPRHGMVQVVLEEGLRWISSSADLEAYFQGQNERVMGLGTPLTEFTMIETNAGSRRYLVWEIHHALYDGWSIPLLLNDVEYAYYNEVGQPLESIKTLIKHIMDCDEGVTKVFWQSQFAGIQGSHFPLIKAATGTYQPRPDCQMNLSVLGMEWGRGDFTAATIIRAAWAVVAAHSARSDEALFGATVTGRQAAVPGIEHMAGPSIATVPLRVKSDWEGSVNKLLHAVQSQAVEMIPFEQTGLQRIRRLGEAAAVACDFQTLLVVQPYEQGGDSASDRLFVSEPNDEQHATANEWQNFSTYAIVIECQLEPDGVHLRFGFDSSIVGQKQMERTSRNFEHVLRQLSDEKRGNDRLKVAAAPSQWGLDDIWTWNAEVPEAMETCAHDLIAQRVDERPYAPAICAWDGDLAYIELDRLSTKLAHQLVDRNIGPGTIVPLCFEKSMWMPVAALAVMKAGAASVALDMTQPEERLRTIATQVGSPVILSSVANEGIAHRFGASDVVIVGGKQSCDLSFDINPTSTRATPGDVLYVVFTSGSTGTPKGAVVTHRNFCSAIKYQQKPLGFSSSSRVFDFASYAFDASWCNLLHALTAGGCLCIPSAVERQNSLPECLETYDATISDFTPSVARFIGPRALSKLSTLILGGEAVLPSDAHLAGNKTQIINVYGPAECTPTVTFAEVPENTMHVGIGRGAGVCTWVVDVDDPKELAPVGAVGELWVEGPLVGQGYLNDPDKTAAAFVQDPEWLLLGAPRSQYPGRRGRLYRTGDLVKYREDGTLAYVGRKDTQVKIRGQRVELGEVEHHVREAVEAAENGLVNAQVIAETIQPRGTAAAMLVAFVALDCADGMSEESHSNAVRQATAGISDRLSDALPIYMVPSAFIPIQRVPMAATGKADRRSLRKIGESLWLQYRSASNKNDFMEAISETERVLQSVWMSVLNLPAEETSVNKSFMRLGGDSITAMQVVSQCRLHNVALTVSDILQAGTIRKLAACCRIISRHTPSTDTDQEEEDEDATGTFDLSPIQQMFFDAYPDGLDHFNQSFMLELSQMVPTSKLQAALRAVVSRHAMLRARFQKDPHSGLWKQSVAADDAQSFVFDEHSVDQLDEVEKPAQWRQGNLNLRIGPVFACDLFNVSGHSQVVLLSAHHAVIDLVSWRIIWNDIEEHVNLGELRSQSPTSFQKWCRQQAKTARTMSPLSVLPYSIPKPELSFWGLPLSDNTFGNCESYTDIIGTDASSLLFGECNESLRTEPIDILVGSLVYSFHKVFPERPVPAIWIEGHGRELSDDLALDVSGTVGWFTTIYPLPILISSESSLVDTIRLAKDMRRQVPGKGRPYFACRYHSESGREAFQGCEVAEITFNFTGRYQQLEREGGLFSRFEEAGDGITEVLPSARRHTMIEVNGDVEEGELAISFQHHKDMRHLTRLNRWFHAFFETVGSATQELLQAPVSFTRSDLPLLHLSYRGLDTLLKEQLPSMGIKCDAISDIYPCSPLQEGILLSSLRGAASYATYSIWQCVPSSGTMAAISTSQLEVAWKIVVKRHAILSTVFGLHPEGDGFVQIVLPGSRIRVTHMVTELDSPTLALDQLESPKFTANEPEHSFTICQSRIGEVACRLDISHTLIDGSSMSILVQEIVAAYDDLALPAAPAFSDMIQYIFGTPRAQKIAPWVALLDGAQPCEFPVNIPLRPMAQNSHGVISLPTNLTLGMVDVCKSLGITRSVFLQVAWAMVLSQFTGMKEVCFGYLASGRDAPVDGVEAMVGPLANMLVSRVDLHTLPRHVLETTSEKSIEHLSIQHASLAEIQHQLGFSGRRLFNTALSIREADKLKGGEGRSLSLEAHNVEDPHEYDLGLSASINGDSIDIAMEFREPYVDRQVAQEACDMLVRAFKYLLRAEAGVWTSQCGWGVSIDAASTGSLFDGFFKHVVGADEASTTAFWKAQFANIQGSHFPTLKAGATYHPQPHSEVRLNVQGLEWNCAGFSPSTMARAAWSIVTARTVGSNEALFGATVKHQELMAGVEPKATSTSAVVPVRVLLDWDGSTNKLLQEVQRQAMEMARFQQTGVQQVRHMSDEAATGCDFQTLLVIEPTDGDGDLAYSPGSHAVVLRCQPEADRTLICISYAADVIEEAEVLRIAHQFEGVLRQLFIIGQREARLGDMAVVSAQDIDDIWTWNAAVPEPVEACVHDLITCRVHEQPQALAINAWDGDLTYRQLDELSTDLAHQLASKGIGPGAIVPLFFGKSMWMPVAALAVMKAGGASVAVDTTQPEERLCAIVAQVQPRIMVSSGDNDALARRVSAGGNEILNVGWDQLSAHITTTSDHHMKLSSASPSDVLYIVFTSGSTGIPKGAKITHQNFSSAVTYQRDALGYAASSRVFDFASYAFDVAWSNLLNTLTVGGCLCIPSSAERQNSLSECLAKYRITLADFTPSVARYIEPKAFSSLSTLLLGGEVVLSSDSLLGGDNTRVVSAYGPAECTPTSTLSDLRMGTEGIGRGVGLCTWIVDVENPEVLAPIGAIGELWLEGPLVGQGYMDSPDKTAAAFVQSPAWLLRGAPGHPGRGGRVYRTGDLVRYNQDGSVAFIGRKDRQVKVRGQRVELGEVEYHVRQAITQDGVQVVAETIQPQGAGSRILVAFVALNGAASMTNGELEGAVQKVTGRLADVLAESMPAYMLPTAYIPIKAIPVTATGKIDRQRLCAVGSSLTAQQIAGLNRADGQRRPPQTDTERLVQALWADILRISLDAIGIDDSFFRLGGDSIGAMRLVGMARQKGLRLQVGDVFRNPVLGDLSAVCVSSAPAPLAS